LLAGGVTGTPPRGTYNLGVGPNITDVAGNAMDQNGNGVNGEPGDAYTTGYTLSTVQTFSSTDVNKTIVDMARTVSTLTINQDVSIADLDVTINLNHTWDSDLRITLVAQDGTQVVLVTWSSGSGDNFTQTPINHEVDA